MRTLTLALIFATLTFAQAVPAKPVKHPKLHKLAHQAVKATEYVGAVVLASATVAAVAMASDGVPIQVR